MSEPFRVLRNLHTAPLAAIALASLSLPSRVQAADPPAIQSPSSYSVDLLKRSPSLPQGTPAEFSDPAAASRPVTNLAEAITRAYWTNPTLVAQRSTLEAADYRVPQARAGYGPRLEGTATYGWQQDRYDQTLGGTFRENGWSTTAQAILTQPIYTFGRNFASERTALAWRDYQHEVLRSTDQQAMADAISAYVSVVRDRAGVQIAQDNLDLLERELRDNEARLNAREVTISDIDQVRTRVELARANLVVSSSTLRASEANFQRATGAPAGDLAKPDPLPLPFATIAEARDLIELHNPVLKAASAREKMSRADAAFARAELMPRVDLRANAQTDALTPYSDNYRQETLRAEVVVSAPIFESGLRRSRLNEAQATNDADWRLLDSALRQSRAELQSAWAEWQAQGVAVKHLELAVKAAQDAYDGALLQERAGLRTTLDVLDLARDLLTTRSNYNNAIASEYVAKVRILAAVGRLHYEALLPDQPHFDSNEHFEKVRDHGDIPILTTFTSALDSIGQDWGKDRPLRDPAATVDYPRDDQVAQ